MWFVGKSPYRALGKMLARTVNSDDFEGCFGTNSTSEIEDRDFVVHVNAAGELFKSTVALKSPSIT